jgi:putative ABC transport system permease protein
MTKAVRLAVIGALIGLGTSLALSRVLATMLFGLKATDTPTYALILIAILRVIALAAAVPAAKEARVDSMIAFRNE